MPEVLPKVQLPGVQSPNSKASRIKARIKRRLGSLYRNLFLKRKFWSFFRLFVDKQYRKDIKRIIGLTAGKDYAENFAFIPVNQIESSHQINYPNWVNELEGQLRARRQLEPIKVVRTGNQIYTVLDGNHRLEAMRRFYPCDHAVPVVLLTELETV